MRGKNNCVNVAADHVMSIKDEYHKGGAERGRILLVTRLLWVVAFIAPLVMGAVYFAAGHGGAVQTGRFVEAGRTVLYVNFALAALMLPVGLFVRNQCYKRNWRAEAVTPRGYLFGNVVLLAICEGLVILSLVNVFLNGALFPAGVPAAAVVAVHLLNFPHGGPMLGHGGCLPALEDR